MKSLENQQKVKLKEESKKKNKKSKTLTLNKENLVKRADLDLQS